jgi:predicted LPLAT superfamily acyltransferase
VLQLLGRYDSAIEAWDTETVRLMKEVGVRGSKPEEFYAAARQRYAKYAPYQFLAYWMELWQNYETRTGTASTRWRRATFSSSL